MGSADRIGYLQSTLQVMEVTPREMLVKLGIYPDPNYSRAPALCRDKKSWAEERTKDDVGYNELLAPKKKEHNQLASRTLAVVDEILKIVVDGNMFTYEEAEQMIETGMHAWCEGTPDMFGRTVVQHEESALVEREPKTHFDVPMMEDLSRKETCKHLIDYTKSIEDQMLAKDTPKGWEEVRPISLDVPFVMACDGAPASQMAHMQIEDPESVPACISSGGFHMLLIAYKAQRKLFAKTHLEDIFGL